MVVGLVLALFTSIPDQDPGNPAGIYNYRQSDSPNMRVFDGKQLWVIMSECAAVIVVYRDTDAQAGSIDGLNRRADSALRLAQIALSNNGVSLPDSQPYIERAFRIHVESFKQELSENPDRIITAMQECNAAAGFASNALER